MLHPRLRPPPWAQLALVALGAPALAALGHALSPAPSGLGGVWPASGLLLGALLLAPPRRWPALLAAALLPMSALAIAGGRPPPQALCLAAETGGGAALGAWLTLRLCGGRPDLGNLGHLCMLALAGPVLGTGMASSAAAAGLALCAGHPFAPTLLRIWSGAALGELAVAPVVLAWAAPGRAPLTARRVAEALGLGASLALVAWLVLGSPSEALPPFSLFLPPLLWAALRFGPRGVTLLTAALPVARLLWTLHPPAAPGGRPGPIAGTLVAQLSSGVAIVSILVLAAVVEGRRQATAALRASERARRLAGHAMDAASDVIVCLDAAGRLRYANDAFLRAVGRERPAVLEAPVWTLVPALSEATWRAHWDRLRAAGALCGNLLPEHPEDGAVPYEVHSAYLCCDGEEYCIAAARDLRERRQAELGHRLASMGTLAAGMAHEINNPLACVMGNLEWVSSELGQALARQVAPSPDALAALQQALQETLGGAGRIRDLVRDLRLFARTGTLEAEVGATGPADVTRVVRGAAALARHAIRQRARLVEEIEAPPPAAVDERRLGQVLLNLLLNAAHAIPEGQPEANLIRLVARQGENGEAVVEVEDTGCGMPPEVRAHIFEPFFTTRRVGGGTGLGLSICHGIVAAVGGRIEVSSRPEKGSLFRIRLPAATRAAPPSAGGGGGGEGGAGMAAAGR